MAAGKLENKKGYNGNEIQAKEFSDGSGLDVYDFNARTYDYQIGRFLQLDPLADEGNDYKWNNSGDILKNPTQNDKSPYAAFWNNPILYNDPDGECPRCAKALIKTAVKSVAKGKLDLGDLYDAVDAVRTIASPESGFLDKGVALFDLFSPLSSKEIKAGAKALGLAEGANDAGKALNKVDNVKNPYGARGKPDHQQKVGELSDKAKAENAGMQVVTEKKINAQGSNRRPDVQVVDPSTGKTIKVYEAERSPGSQRNQKREAEYKKLGVPFETHKVGGN